MYHAARYQAIPKARATQETSLWWMRPIWLISCFIIPIYLLIVFASSHRESSDVTVRGMWFLNEYYLTLGLALLLFFALGAWFGDRIQPLRATNSEQLNCNNALWVLGTACFIAYIVWFKEVLFSPSVMAQILTGGGKPTRNEIGTAVGITSLSNFIIPFFSLYMYCAVYQGARMQKGLVILARTLVGLTIFRVYIWSERLAMIELVCSAMVPISLIAPRTEIGKRHAILLNSIPFIGIPLLLVYFGVFEYFRSWQSDTYNGKTEFWSFAVGRLASYYITALNNGAGQLATSDGPSFQFENTLGWLHKAPLGLGDLFNSITETRFSRNFEYLQNFGDPEFNNPSGLFVVVVDMGIPLAIMYFFFFGILCSRLYQGYSKGNINSILFYPLLFIATLEVLRIPYLGESRAFTACIGGLLAKILIYREISAKK